MAAGKLVWDKTGERFYETGVDRGVLYPFDSEENDYGEGVAWNGLSNVTESPSGAEPTAVYADNIKYLNLFSAEEFGANIEAYSYPKEFGECDGSAEIAKGVSIGQQDRKQFGFCYRTLIGSDTQGNNDGYKIHIVYGAQASPSEVSHDTVSDSPEPSPLSWEVSTTPVNVTGHKPTAHLVIDSRYADPEKLTQLENILYGQDAGAEGTPAAAAARLPLPDEVVTLMGVAA